MIGVHFIPLGPGKFQGVLIGPMSGKAYFAYEDEPESPFWFGAHKDGEKKLNQMLTTMREAYAAKMPAIFEVASSGFVFCPDELEGWIVALSSARTRFMQEGLEQAEDNQP